MDIQEFKRNYYLFDPKKYGRIFVFVDFANVHWWAKEFWPEENKEYFKVDIDIEKLAEVCNWIKPKKRFFYYGHFKEYPDLGDNNPLNIKYRKSIYRIDKARKCGFKTRTKDIKEIKNFAADGKFLGKINKCNFDIEICMDMLMKIDKYDTVFFWSGDSDFYFLLRYLRSKGKKVIVICARSFSSNELESSDTSNLFIPADPLKDFLEYKKNTPGKSREE